MRLMQWFRRPRKGWRVEIEVKATLLCDWLLLGRLPPFRSSEEVMIVRVDAIGDFVLWLDAAKELRQAYPGRKLVLFANSLWADLALRINLWDEVRAVDVARLERFSLYRYRLLRAIRARGFGLALQPTFSRVFLAGDTLIRASGAPERIGSVGDLSHMEAHEKQAADRYYTRLLPADPAWMTELDRNAELVTRIRNVRFTASCPIIPRLGDLPQHLRIGVPYLIVFPGASAPYRQWPAEHFATTAGRLAAETALTTVLCGSPGERSLCEEVASRLTGPVINLAGRTALWELAEVIREARLLLSNETSAVHIAAAVGTYSVCLLGGGHYGRFMPYGDAIDSPFKPDAVLHPMACFGCNWRCTQPHVKGGPVPCISGISPSNVLHASRKRLSMSSFDPVS